MVEPRIARCFGNSSTIESSQSRRNLSHLLDDWLPALRRVACEFPRAGNSCWWARRAFCCLTRSPSSSSASPASAATSRSRGPTDYAISPCSFPMGEFTGTRSSFRLRQERNHEYALRFLSYVPRFPNGDSSDYDG